MEIGTLLLSAFVLAYSGLAAQTASAQVTPPPGAGNAIVAPEADKSYRPSVVIVGSSTLHQTITPAIVKVFTDIYKTEAPIVRSTGTSKGIEEFCAGVGVKYPDIVAASRNIRKGEFEECRNNGVLDIIEVKIGVSPVLVITAKDNPTFDVTPRMIYLAAADRLPVGEEFKANAFMSWREVDKHAPDKLIQLVIPNSDSGLRGFIDDWFLEGGCRHYETIDAIFSAAERVEQCTTLRHDDVIIELQEPYAATMAQLVTAHPSDTITVGIAGELTYLEHADELKLLPVYGFLPTTWNVNNDDYRLVAFPRYYFKRAHMRNNSGQGVVRGLRELIRIISSEEMTGPDGVFDNLGLIPLEEDERESVRENAIRLKSIER